MVFWYGVSPPTRGWTVRGGAFSVVGRGFPAHAGMDLLLAVPAPFTARFPRPRGDGPLCDQCFPPIFGVSPPTRGWT